MWARAFYILSMYLLGTQVIILPGIPFSLFQISILFTGIFSLVSFPKIRFRKTNRYHRVLGGIKTGSFLPFSIIYLISSIIAFIISRNPSPSSFFLLSLMTFMLVFFMPLFFGRSDIDMLEKVLIRSQYIVIPFAIYTIYCFYFGGGLPTQINLPGGLSIQLEEEALRRGRAGAQMRLMLPYATPPVLSCVMAICLVILFFNKRLFPRLIRRLLIVVYGIILLLTGSRTGLVSLLLFFVIYSLGRSKKGKWISLGLLVVLIVAFVLLASKISYLAQTLSRLSSLGEVEMMDNRHFLIPLDGILLWLGSVRSFLLGIGMASGAYMDGAHTALPPYFLNSFVTLVAERGLMGILLVVLLVRLSTRLFKERNHLTAGENALSYSLLVSLCSFFFYECLNCYFVVFIIAIAFMLERRIVLSMPQNPSPVFRK